MESKLSLTDQLKTGLSILDLDLDNEEVEQLVKYLQLLDKWNKAYNLSGIKEVQRMVAYHLLDSLAIVPHLDGNIILDVGTGAGLPGIPLAICFPEKSFYCWTAMARKHAFFFRLGWNWDWIMLKYFTIVWKPFKAGNKLILSCAGHMRPCPR